LTGCHGATLRTKPVLVHLSGLLSGVFVRLSH
jgi:hypothetical protein